jgi:predicted Rossmann fold nucleotide-binding protein DprA/Smf involved in DNA uptake
LRRHHYPNSEQSKSTVFIGGSRRVARLPAQVTERLNKIIGSGFRIVVGDAAGVDNAVRKYLMDASYSHVTVFCSSDRVRSNLGSWDTHENAIAVIFSRNTQIT